MSVEPPTRRSASCRRCSRLRAPPSRRRAAAARRRCTCAATRLPGRPRRARRLHGGGDQCEGSEGGGGERAAGSRVASAGRQRAPGGGERWVAARIGRRRALGSSSKRGGASARGGGERHGGGDMSGRLRAGKWRAGARLAVACRRERWVAARIGRRRAPGSSSKRGGASARGGGERHGGGDMSGRLGSGARVRA
jgi:hypothetical protein